MDLEKAYNWLGLDKQLGGTKPSRADVEKAYEKRLKGNLNGD